MLCWMTAVGHEDAFLRPRLNSRNRFSKGTLAGTRCNGRDAPIAVIGLMASTAYATRRGLRHIGGLMPSFSTYMKFAVTLPSSPFGPARNTVAPGFSRLLSPGTGARIGTSGPMLY